MGQGGDKDGKEIGPTRGAKLVSGGARITSMVNKNREYMRLAKRRSGLAFGSTASRRCAAGTRRNFQ